MDYFIDFMAVFGLLAAGACIGVAIRWVVIHRRKK